ncbi:cysteine protease, autophagy-related protein 4, ATG4 [Pseudohyphozyma bogoriensis]|nr:cysteine protease, autophagy-related protein 4, ATG4 [Pseudohyphozyma bogoriensis]
MSVRAPSPSPVRSSSPPPLSTTSNTNSNAPGLAAPLSTHPNPSHPAKKLTKWLSSPSSPVKTRGRSNSATPAATSPAVEYPGISLSPSPSTSLSSPTSSPPRSGNPPSPTQTFPRSSSSSMLSGVSGHGEGSSRGFSALGLRTSRRASSQMNEPPTEGMQEWTTDFDDEFSGAGGDADDTKGKKKGFSLKRTKSGLKLFGQQGKTDRDTSPVEKNRAGGALGLRGKHVSKDSSSTMGFEDVASPSSERRPSTSSSFVFNNTSTANFPSISNSPQGANANGNGNVTGRIGGWFTSILHSSSTHLPLPQSSTIEPPLSTPPLPSASSSGSLRLSPKKSSTGSRLGPLDRIMDKAAAYFLDADSGADKCPDEIWVLGVRHEGPPISIPQQTIHGWPADFYHDFYSRIALTYRSGFPPIPCSPPPSGVQGVFDSLSMSIGRGSQRTVDGLSSDSGWGCMLRTGQSLLANSLMKVHLGRDWRRPLPPLAPPQTATSSSPSSPSLPQPLSPQHAEYARIISLFIDDPSPLAPFSVHRFALMGKQLGKEVGEWFGPSTAAGAIKTLVGDFEPAGLAVESVGDGTIYKDAVEEAAGMRDGKWQKPVLVLIQLRLGIDGVNLIYYEAIKTIFNFPQSVGIAGGRPSSSYYFVGAQANSLFYIDPHHSRPSVPLRQPPPELFGIAQSLPLSTPLAPSLNPTSTTEPTDYAVSDSFVTVIPASPAVTVSNNGVSEEKLADFFVDAYPDSALRSYHTERVRKMPLSSLDPSMLVGFLIQDEGDWEDFSSRVHELAQNHKPIFALADSPPAWMRRSAGPESSTEDSDKGVDSFSEPDDDWLDSSGPGSSTSIPQGGPGGFDDDWTDEVAAPEGVASALESPTPATEAPRSSSGTPAMSISGEESMVVVDPPKPRAGGESGGLAATEESVRFEKEEEGWEGVVGKPDVAASSGMGDSVAHLEPYRATPPTQFDTPSGVGGRVEEESRR